MSHPVVPSPLEIVKSAMSGEVCARGTSPTAELPSPEPSGVVNEGTMLLVASIPDPCAAHQAAIGGVRPEPPPDDEPPTGEAQVRAPKPGPKGGSPSADGPTPAPPEGVNSSDFQGLTVDVSYYGYRWYDCVTGRWPSRDPIGEHSFYLSYSKNKALSDKLKLNFHSIHAGYKFINNDPPGNVDLLGLHAIFYPPGSPGSEYNDDIQSHLQNPKPSVPAFVGVEAHVVLGIGYSAVTCCDENDDLRRFHFMKVCYGLNASASVSGGAVTGLSGEDCRADRYKGVFYEFSGSIGPVSIGVDLGVNDDNELTGVNDIAGGFGVGLPVGVSYCYYFLISESKEEKGCVCTEEESSSSDY